MKNKKQQQNWDSIAEVDALWGILSLEGKRGRKWDIKEFFLTGESEFNGLLNRIKSIGINLNWGYALDFGCGVGRLTQAAAKYFQKCYGVDISSKMIEIAGQYNTHGDKCAYVVNTSDNLSVFNDDYFDFIFSKITLQHIAGRINVKRYIAEFIRTVKPGGVAAFQCISYLPFLNRLQPKRRAYDFLHMIGLPDRLLLERFNLYPVRLNYISENELVEFIEGRKGVVKHVDNHRFSGGVIHSIYYVTK